MPTKLDFSGVNALFSATRAQSGKKAPSPSLSGKGRRASQAGSAAAAPAVAVLVTEESAAATVFTFTPKCCICLPSCRRHRVVVTADAGVFRSEGLNCLAADAHESFAWRDVVLLRSVAGGRQGLVLAAFFIAAVLVGLAAALSVKAKQADTGAGVGVAVFLVLAGVWLLMRSASLRALTLAAGEHVLAPSNAGFDVSPGELKKALRACAAAWSAARGGGGPSGKDADPTAPCASPTAHTRLVNTIAGTSHELSARAGGLLVVQKSAGFLRLPLITTLDTSAFFASAVRYTALATGNRTLPGFALALAPVLLAVLLSEAPQACNASKEAPCSAPIACAAVLGVLLLLRWYFSLQVTLTMNLGDPAGLQPWVRLPQLEYAGAHAGVLAALLGGEHEAPGAPPPPPAVSVTGRDFRGNHVELTVGPALTSIKVTIGTSSSLQRFLCQTCLATEEHTCRTRSILFASTSRTDLINTLLASLVLCALVIAIVVIIDSR